MLVFPENRVPMMAMNIDDSVQDEVMNDSTVTSMCHTESQIDSRAA